MYYGGTIQQYEKIRAFANGEVERFFFSSYISGEYLFYKFDLR